MTVCCQKLISQQLQEGGLPSDALTIPDCSTDQACYTADCHPHQLGCICIFSDKPCQNCTDWFEAGSALRIKNTLQVITFSGAARFSHHKVTLPRKGKRHASLKFILGVQYQAFCPCFECTGCKATAQGFLYAGQQSLPHLLAAVHHTIWHL